MFNAHAAQVRGKSGELHSAFINGGTSSDIGNSNKKIFENKKSDLFGSKVPTAFDKVLKESENKSGLNNILNVKDGHKKIAQTDGPKKGIDPFVDVLSKERRPQKVISISGKLPEKKLENKNLGTTFKQQQIEPSLQKQEIQKEFFPTNNKEIITPSEGQSQRLTKSISDILPSNKSVSKIEGVKNYHQQQVVDESSIIKSRIGMPANVAKPEHVLNQVPEKNSDIKTGNLFKKNISSYLPSKESREFKELLREGEFSGTQTQKDGQQYMRLSDVMFGNQNSATTTINSKVATKVLDISNVNLNNTEMMIEKISNYIQEQQVQNLKTVDLVVSHKDLGQFKVSVNQLSGMQNSNIGIEIVTNNQAAYDFFHKNEGALIRHLAQSGIELGEIKISNTHNVLAMNIDGEKQSSSNERGSNQQGFENFKEKRDPSSDQQSSRRRDLWEEVKEKMGA